MDGEVALFDERLISRFKWLRRRAPAEIATPPLFMVFDCPYARGKDLRDRPLYVRRNVIEDTLDDQDLLLPVRRLADDGLKAWHLVLERGYEGLVAKDRSYRLDDGGGESDHRCPIGKRNICQECVSADGYNCRTHGVKTKMGV
jgi:ATP-dependent DNA ligase